MGAQRGKEMLSELRRPVEEEAKEMAGRGRSLALWALTKTWVLFSVTMTALGGF